MLLDGGEVPALERGITHLGPDDFWIFVKQLD